MAEMLVFTEDRITGDVAIDRHRPGKGCVIVVEKDGHAWSEAERTEQFWRIVKFPGVDPTLLSQFTRSSIGYGEREAEELDPTLLRWTDKFDLESFDEMKADTVIAEEIEKDAGKALVYALAVRKKRAELVDPKLIGPKISAIKIIGRP